MQTRILSAALAIAATIAFAAASAQQPQVYKWKDANGVTHFSQTPPSNGTAYTKMRLTNEPDVSSNPSASSGNGDNTGSDTGTSQQTAPASSTQPDTASNRATLCKQLDSNISLLQGKQPVVTDGADGKQEVMSDNAREAQLATARAQQAQYCSSSGT
jgi:hypothetical protein